PMPWDGVRFVLNRLEEGWELLDQVRVKPSAWIAPHYQASPLDYEIFGQVFNWNMGRAIYFPFVRVHQAQRLPEALTLERSGLAGRAGRLRYLADLSVECAPELAPNGQFFPYEIYGDVYGQRLIPEDVGNVQPYLTRQVLKTVAIDDMIRVLRRNRVLRDVWGSFFFHPFQLENTARDGGRPCALERLVREARRAGYEFVDLKAWIRDAPLERRPEPIERRLGD
ncbi:MAG: DUF2334 domain-containing protein, partial [Elusimicrobia bacterium]|nr:DUF2334 domain-containing protein [Elusimicrobiota bacterium]